MSKYAVANLEREGGAQKLDAMDIPCAKDTARAGTTRPNCGEERAPLNRTPVFADLNSWQFRERSGRLLKLLGRGVRLKGVTTHVETIVVKGSSEAQLGRSRLPEAVGRVCVYGCCSGSEALVGLSAATVSVS